MARLSLSEQKRIDDVIHELESRIDLSYPKDDLLKIIHTLGIEVNFLHLPKVEGREVDGVVKWENGVGVIFINDAYSSTRKTFTLAHELGHYFLHRGSEKLRVDTFNYTTNTKEALEETEANYFAASLLMPKDELRRLLNFTNDLSAIASYFGVSESAVRTRIKWLETNVD